MHLFPNEYAKCINLALFVSIAIFYDQNFTIKAIYKVFADPDHPVVFSYIAAGPVL